MPNFLGHPDNYIMANPLVTPAHIVPEWYYLPFYAILRDPRYAQIDSEAFQEMQKAMGHTRPRSIRSADFPLRGTLTCHHCQRPLTASMAKGRYAYYHCKTAGHASISAAQINDAVAVLLSELSGAFYVNLPAIKASFDRVTHEAGDVASATVARCRDHEADLTRKMERLVEAMLAGRLPDGMYDRKRVEIEAALASVREELADAQVDCLEIGSAIDLAADLLVDLPTLWNGSTPASRATMLRIVWPRGIDVDGNTVRTCVKDSIFGTLCASDGAFFTLAPPTGEASNMLKAITQLMEVAA
jgi:hypothetical protein